MNNIVVPVFWAALWPGIVIWCDTLDNKYDCLIDQGVGHTLPIISVFILILTGDITMVEKDWRSCFVRSLFYVPCNIAGTIFMGTGVVYGFEAWGTNFWT